MDAQTTIPSPESFETVYVDPHFARFGYDGENLTFIDADGAFYPRVTLRRCFPLSAKNTNVLVRVPEAGPEAEPDRGREIGIIQDVDALEPESREAVLRELRLHYFVPVIRQIYQIREEFGFLYWVVETDRGKKEFTMRDSIIGHVRQVSKGRWLIIDINQTRYEVHDFEMLDTHSQDLLRRHLLL
jgi:hypothetical protein